ncbi:MAG: hypothetical protein ACO20H_11830 [Bacteriovoracaceae bacterium]
MGDEKDDKYDLTSLTELGEFLHELDPEVDAQLEHGGDGPSESSEQDEDAPVEFNEFKVPTPGSATEEEPLEEQEDSFTDSGFSDGDDQFQETSFSDENSESEDNSFESDDQGFEEASFTDENNEFGQDGFSDETTELEEDAFSDQSTELEEDAFSDETTELEEDAFSDEATELEEDAFSGEATEQDGESIDEPDQQTESIEQNNVEQAPAEAPSVPSPEQMAVPEINKGPAAPEDFQEVKNFSDKMSYGLASGNGNPPFSIILSNIKYKEDVHEILAILKEHGIANDSNENDYLKGLENGHTLISQLSEYVAIYLGVKFKKYDLDIKLGLSEEIHPTDSYTHNLQGLVNKQSLNQNHQISMNLEDLIINPDEVLVTTMSNFEGQEINRYISIITDNLVINEQELASYDTEAHTNANIDLTELIDEEFENASGLTQVYDLLINKLKLKAAQLKGNALVGINFQMHPLAGPTPKYQITCTGNLVWVSPSKKGIDEQHT